VPLPQISIPNKIISAGPARRATRWLRRRSEPGSHPRGQNLVELALIVPLLLFMALAIFDFARVFTAAITVEAAAREAADFGALYRWNWKDTASADTTEANMLARACSAASTLTDYVGDPPSDTAACSNPTFSYRLINDTSYASCYDVPREEDPCRVEVTLDYDFHVIVPLSLTFGDTTLGVPPDVALTRTSTFAVSDFELDEEPGT
jgi:Flp pilus assembly protein TadG